MQPAGRVAGCILAAVRERPSQKLRCFLVAGKEESMMRESVGTIQKLGDGQIEIYKQDIFFSKMSETEKDRFLKDIPAFVKELLEEQGHTVNRIHVTTEFEQHVRDGIATSRKGGGGSEVRKNAGYYHIAWPETSAWI